LAAIKSHTIFVPPHFGAHLLILMKCSSPAFSRKKKGWTWISLRFSSKVIVTPFYRLVINLEELMQQIYLGRVAPYQERKCNTHVRFQ
jgi:hypothetical protein